jgi:branched-chain amino acid transport system ATP-binding protein
MLEVRNVTKEFAGFVAVRDFSLDLGDGQIRGLIGPNGAGKSTLLNMLTGLFPPTSGSISLNGRNIAGLPPHQICHEGVFRSFQITSIFPNYTVFDNVQIAVLAREGRTRNLLRPSANALRARVWELLSFLKMEGSADAIAGELAAGDRKLLEFGIALAGRPTTLLLDEPTAGMSPSEKSLVCEIILQINRKEGVSVLFTEHDIDMVFSLAESVIVMSQGAKIAEGPPSEMKTNKKVQEVYLGARHAS